MTHEETDINTAKTNGTGNKYHTNVIFSYTPYSFNGEFS